MRDRLEAVILDMDGVLLDTEPLAIVAWRRCLSRLGCDVDDDEFWKATVGVASDEICRRLTGRIPASIADAELAATVNKEFERQIAAAGALAMPNAASMLAALRQRGVPVAVATSTETTAAERLLDRAGLLSMIDIVTGGDLVARRKPAADVYLLAARRMKQRPEYCIAVEDSATGLAAAVAAGMVTILLSDPQSPPNASAAVRICRSLGEAARVIDQMLMYGIRKQERAR